MLCCLTYSYPFGLVSLSTYMCHILYHYLHENFPSQKINHTKCIPFNILGYTFILLFRIIGGPINLYESVTWLANIMNVAFNPQTICHCNESRGTLNRSLTSSGSSPHKTPPSVLIYPVVNAPCRKSRSHRSSCFYQSSMQGSYAICTKSFLENIHYAA